MAGKISSTSVLPNICVVIHGSTLDELKKQAKEAQHLGANHIEVRLDLCKNPLELPLETIGFEQLKTILTMRDAKEGGSPQHQKSREMIIDQILNSEAEYIDIEIQNVTDNILSKRNPNKLILSKHWFTQPPQVKVMNELLQEYGNLGTIKMIPMARNYEDNLTILNFLTAVGKKHDNLICFCMGKHGSISRILSPLYGSRLTYASLGDPVAPGQLSLPTLRRIYNDLIS